MATVKASPPLKTVSLPPVLTQAYLLPPKKSSECPLPSGVSEEKVPPLFVPWCAFPEVSAIALAVALSSKSHSPTNPSRVMVSYPTCPSTGVNLGELSKTGATSLKGWFAARAAVPPHLWAR